LVKLMECPAITQPVNLGNPTELSMLDIADLVLAATGARVPLVYRDLPVDDPAHRCPDISLAQRRLGWRPKVSAAQGIARTVADFSTRLARQSPRAGLPIGVPERG